MAGSTTTGASSATVAVIRCATYDYATVDAAIARGIDLLGGPGRFAHAGERILLKPNVLWGTDPARCIVTHPAILRATAAQLCISGVTVQYGDSPAALPRATVTIKRCGYREALGPLPVEQVAFDDGVDVDYPAGLAGKKLRIARAALDTDGIINLPKLKTHGLVRMTGAVKNLFGCVPGAIKGTCHARFPDVYDFSALLADIARFCNARLHIMDAIEAMEGNGPQSGTPRKLGALLLSTDPVALDLVACRLIDLDPTFVPTIAAGEHAGLGCGDVAAIHLVGDEIEPLIDRQFSVVRLPPPRLPSNNLLRTIRQTFLPRPVAVKMLCSRCGRCVTVCPVTPLAISQTGQQPPRYDYRSCIRCFCCQEICPSKAIIIKTPLIGRLFPLLSYLSLLVARSNSRRTPPSN